MKKEYQIWYVPLRKAETFGWEPKLIASHDCPHTASFHAWELMTDSPSPDKFEYYGYHVEEVTIN